MSFKDEENPANRKEQAKKETKGHGSTKKGVSHMTTIQKWGNSLAVRIPNQYAKNLGVKHGSEVELELSSDELIVKPVKNKITLDDLLAKAEGKTNPHLDYDFGRPEGKEML
ncbi:AbrB/MazE/SpoVT family DNA-binding domain-containing protein [Evansella clarkii]|uniref:AbrB/MazE/SpoVT family DNA-binding domain-containing protein n=1 Tax=Evansella clarkii TaxID=79879 RepID=UPI001FD3B9BD|nr:AbrB/MazE/SpoVT family DNA-binding domain-containing protein [Evansella clarkii]